MSESERILTRHPEGKKGVNIEKSKYTDVRHAIINCLRVDKFTYTELAHSVQGKLGDSFSGSIRWYTEVVKLDLEARRKIRWTDDKPQKYELL